MCYEFREKVKVGVDLKTGAKLNFSESIYALTKHQSLSKKKNYFDQSIKKSL